MHKLQQIFLYKTILKICSTIDKTVVVVGSYFEVQNVQDRTSYNSMVRWAISTCHTFWPSPCASRALTTLYSIITYPPAYPALSFLRWVLVLAFLCVVRPVNYNIDMVIMEGMHAVLYLVLWLDSRHQAPLADGSDHAFNMLMPCGSIVSNCQGVGKLLIAFNKSSSLYFSNWAKTKYVVFDRRCPISRSLSTHPSINI